MASQYGTGLGTRTFGTLFGPSTATHTYGDYGMSLDSGANPTGRWYENGGTLTGVRSSIGVTSVNESANGISQVRGNAGTQSSLIESAGFTTSIEGSQ